MTHHESGNVHELNTGKRGRPRLGTRRTIIVNDQQWSHWQAWCIANGESVSGIIRRLMDRQTGWQQGRND